MRLGEKLVKLRVLEGHARGFDRELTQTEVCRAIRDEQHGAISQPYLSQLESGARPHMTGATRLLLAKFFRVHPGYLVDDAEGFGPPLPPKLRRELDDKLDLWLIDGSLEFAQNPRLGAALLAIAKHPNSKECLILLASLVENRQLIDHLVEKLVPAQAPKRRRAR